MALPRGSSRGRARLPSRRRKGWEEGVMGGVVVTQTASGSIFVGSAVTPTLDGLTLLRLRGSLFLGLRAGAAGVDRVRGAFGIGIATAAAVAVGVTAVPTPVTEQSWDGWIYWENFYLENQDGTTQTYEDGSGLVRMPIDTKAMRKLTEDDAIYAAIETTHNGTVVLSVQGDSRILFALP